jgi:hypothetical protein
MVAPEAYLNVRVQDGLKMAIWRAMDTIAVLTPRIEKKRLMTAE